MESQKKKTIKNTAHSHQANKQLKCLNPQIKNCTNHPTTTASTANPTSLATAFPPAVTTCCGDGDGAAGTTAGLLGDDTGVTTGAGAAAVAGVGVGTACCLVCHVHDVETPGTAATAGSCGAGTAAGAGTGGAG